MHTNTPTTTTKRARMSLGSIRNKMLVMIVHNGYLLSVAFDQTHTILAEFKDQDIFRRMFI